MAPASEQPVRAAPVQAAAEQAAPVPADPATDLEASMAEVVQARPSLLRRLSLMHVVLLANTFLIIFLAAGVFKLLTQKPQPVEAGSRDLTELHALSEKPSTLQASASQPSSAPADDEVTLPQGVSWPEAEAAFVAKQYRQAMTLYKQLLQAAASRGEEPVVLDFFRVRLGDCVAKLDQPAMARRFYQQAGQSDSPAVAAAALYRLARLDLAEQQHLVARMRSYQAVVALGLTEGLPALERECDFLAARALTAGALAMYNLDIQQPAKEPPLLDVFAGLDGAALDKLLRQGGGAAGASSLAPRITRASPPKSLWTITCRQAPLEELLSRFAQEAGLEVEWVAVAAPVRRRPVSLRLTDVTEQRFSELACGWAGLLARFTGSKIIVHDVAGMAVSSQQRELLAQEAASAWRRLFLRAPQDSRIPTGHLAVAQLQECLGETVEALREYALTLKRFQRDPAAPQALLASARLRIKLRDFPGARQDLLDLLNTYPHVEQAQDVYLKLAEATMHMGQGQEAAKLFGKVYFLQLSRASQASASWGAGQCLFELGQFKEASTWLERYVKLAGAEDEAELARAWLLLGRCESSNGKLPEAASALRKSLALAKGGEGAFAASLELAQVEARRERFGAAVAVLEGLERQKLPEADAAQAAAVQGKVYRQMGLPERALAALRSRCETVSDEQTKAAIQVEMARCQLDAQEPQQAYTVLVEALGHLPSGAASDEASCLLGELCVQLGKADQAIRLAQELLKRPAGPELRQRCSAALARAHLLKQEYAKAADALSGGIAPAGGANE